MNKTLIFMSTHFIDEAVISEYKKMRDNPDVDAILAIDNNAYKYDFQNRVEDKIFYGVNVKCFFFDSKLHDEINLPYFTDSDTTATIDFIMCEKFFLTTNIIGRLSTTFFVMRRLMKAF